tara:strand:+ start:914 stop:1165 length:252 start_codon:yes stop_codon:yes gene_type:complete
MATHTIDLNIDNCKLPRCLSGRGFTFETGRDTDDGGEKFEWFCIWAPDSRFPIAQCGGMWVGDAIWDAVDHMQAETVDDDRDF